MSNKQSSVRSFALALVFSGFVSIGLLLVRIAISGSSRYEFLAWNLLLAAIPLLISIWLVQRVAEYGWTKPAQMLLTIFWLSFLPNSFYLITDFIHLRETYEVGLLFDIVLLMSFALNGIVLGFASIYLVHKQIIKRIPPLSSMLIIQLVLLASSFASYLGRYTRWNSWDIVMRPAGLLFDVSDRFINPSLHEQTYLTTILIFSLLSSLYLVVWQSAKLTSER